MRFIIIFLVLTFVTATSFASTSDTLIIALKKAINEAHLYDEIKVQRIATLKHQITNQNVTNIDKQYSINLQLYDEYKYYNYDSALVYAKALQRIATNKNNTFLLADAKLKAIFIMLSSGMFKETFDSLNSISVKNAPDSVKAEYYSLMGRSYYNLADFNGDAVNTPLYNLKANSYLDSALVLYPKTIFESIYYSAIRFLKQNKIDSALANLQQLLTRQDLTYHQTALATSTIGGILMSQGNVEAAKPYLIKASIADIQSSTKETLALLVLAEIMYKEGDINDAVVYIEKANTDASFYNARLRKAQVGAILPLIEGSMIQTIKEQKEKLKLFLITLSGLVILLAGFAIIIRNQVKKLKVARENLFEANLKLKQINDELFVVNELKEVYNIQLKEINNQLVEANATKESYNTQLKKINQQLAETNRIKEEYIGYYFNLDTEFIARTEKFITSLDKKLTDRKWDEMRFILRSVDLKKEKEELLKNFDKVFLRLFPNFVAQFNTLFNDEDRIVLKEDQLLNTELRIFALIRLGVTENEKIAEILDYSINTIYAKKTKVRSRTIINKDEFEKRIVEITTING